jgi:hypothetical protein
VLAQRAGAGGTDADRAVVRYPLDPSSGDEAVEQPAARIAGQVVALLGPVDAVAHAAPARRQVRAQLGESQLQRSSSEAPGAMALVAMARR